MNSHHPPIREDITERPQGNDIAGVVECWNQHCGVGDLEVRITRGQALAIEVDGGRHRQGHNLDLRSVFQAHVLQALPIFLEWSVIRVVHISFPAENDGARIYKPAQVINVPVRVVAGNSLAEPENIGYAQVSAEDRGDFLASKTRVADLHGGIEQAFLRSQERAESIGVNAAAFQNKPTALHHGVKHAASQRPRRSRRNLAILSPVRILRPTCEAETRNGHVGARRVTLHKHGAEVARPAAIGGKAEKLHALQIHANPFENTASFSLVVFRVDQNSHDFAGNDVTYDLTVHPGDGGEFLRPVGEVVRPPDPRGLMRFPLSRHAVAAWGLGAGGWVVGASGWGLGAGDWMLGTREWVLGTGCWLLGIPFSAPRPQFRGVRMHILVPSPQPPVPSTHSLVPST